MGGGIDDGYRESNNIMDGLEMLVRFYDNHGQLKPVSDKTGVPMTRLQKWLSGGKLLKSDKGKLCKDVDPSFTGEVKTT